MGRVPHERGPTVPGPSKVAAGNVVHQDGFCGGRFKGACEDDLPRIGGCLVRIARTFIREKLGSALRLVADVLGALDADLALIRGDAEVLPPPPR